MLSIETFWNKLFFKTRDINEVPALPGGIKDFVTMEEEGSNIVHNWVTSFMDDP